jgi:phosphatidylserine/phosphatidylglycerophosphate/cardiolipin synthase-like enzyme
MSWLLLATGFTGALTLVYLTRCLVRLLHQPASVQAHFSPHGGCTEVVVAELGRAHREVLVQAFSFTSKPIAEALVAAKGRGVTVIVLLDKSNEVETHTELPWLVEQGLAPLIDAHHAIAHNKVMVIDGHTIITGSFNFTHQAEAENAENLLVLRGHPELARAYRQQFEAHREHCREPQARGAAHADAPAHHDRKAA